VWLNAPSYGLRVIPLGLKYTGREGKKRKKKRGGSRPLTTRMVMIRVEQVYFSPLNICLGENFKTNHARVFAWIKWDVGIDRHVLIGCCGWGHIGGAAGRQTCPHLSIGTLPLANPSQKGRCYTNVLAKTVILARDFACNLNYRSLVVPCPGTFLRPRHCYSMILLTSGTRRFLGGLSTKKSIRTVHA